MATFHLRVKTVSRSAGRSATAAAAYRSGTKIRCEREQRVHDYRRRSGVVSRDLFFPKDAEWARTAGREAIWNAAEAAEVRKNATVAREYEVAIPCELSPQGRRALVSAFAQELCDSHQVIADVAIHEPNSEGDQRNWHAHILTTTRRATPEGLGEKTRELDDREQGPRAVTRWRERWEALANNSLAKEDHSERITCRSLKAQRDMALIHADATADPVKAEKLRIEAAALDREAEPHMGPRATAMERKARREAAEQGVEYTPVTEVGKMAAEAAAKRRFAADLLDTAQLIFNDYWGAIKKGWNALRGRSDDDEPAIPRKRKPSSRTSQAVQRPLEATSPDLPRQGEQQPLAPKPSSERRPDPAPTVTRARPVELPRDPEPESFIAIETEAPEITKANLRLPAPPHFAADLSRRIDVARRAYEAAKDDPGRDSVDLNKLRFAHQRLSAPQLMQEAREQDDQLRREAAEFKDQARHWTPEQHKQLRDQTRDALDAASQRGAPASEIAALRASYHMAIEIEAESGSKRDNDFER